MAWIPEDLKQMKALAERGENASATVRTLLSWFGQQRRGVHVVSMIRRAFRSLEIITVPDFDSIWIDGLVHFVRRASDAHLSGAGTLIATGANSTPLQNDNIAAPTTDTPVRVLADHDPSYNVGKLEAANRIPVSVTPDSTVSEAISLMLINDFSQLPVMSGERSVKGLFSWKSLASRLALKRPCDKVSEAMDPVETLGAEASIFQVAGILAKQDVVLIKSSLTDSKIIGILTTTDLTEQFGRLGEPFLLLSEIENRVRLLLDGKLTATEMSSGKDPTDTGRIIETVADLTFGEYVRLFQNPDTWIKCKLDIDRATFVKHLDEIRVIRNDVMHFDPDGIEPQSLERLRAFARFLGRLNELVA